MAVNGAELVERPARNLHDDVVDRRLEGGESRAGDIVRYLVESVSNRYLGGNSCDGISRRFGRQGRRARYAGIDFDQAVVSVGGIECELYVASALYAQGPDDIDRRRSEALVVAVRDRQQGRAHYAFSRVYPHRVQVLHLADDYAVILGVPHDLVFELLPSEDAFLD